MDGDCKVGDEFGAGDEEQQEDDAVGVNVLASRQVEGCVGDIPYHTVHHPAETEHPTCRDIASNSAPAEERISRDIPAGDQSGEQNQGSCDGVV